MNNKVIGLCGRQGAGKTTTAKFITGQNTARVVEYKNPWAYVLSCLFPWKYEELMCYIPITKSRVTLLHSVKSSKIKFENSDLYVNKWNLSVYEALKYVIHTIETVFPDIVSQVPDTVMCYDDSTTKQKWVEISLADPLKKICSAITGADYEMLLGESAANRKIRETVEFTIGEHRVTGRMLLIKIATAFRKHFDPEFWVKIAEQNIIPKLKCSNVVISDIRFKNEYEMLKRLNGTLITICKNYQDLIITEEDKKQHPSKWEFLTFCTGSITIENYDSMENLKRKIQLNINSLD